MAADHAREARNQLAFTALLSIPWLPAVMPGTMLAVLDYSVSSSSLTATGTVLTVMPMLSLVSYYSRGVDIREREADFIGMLLMSDAGYDPAALGSFLESIVERKAERTRQLDESFKGMSWLDRIIPGNGRQTFDYLNAHRFVSTPSTQRSHHSRNLLGLINRWLRRYRYAFHMQRRMHLVCEHLSTMSVAEPRMGHKQQSIVFGRT